MELSDVHYQLQLQSNRLLKLCAHWQKPLEPLTTGDGLPPWGPSADALLNARIHSVTASVSMDTEGSDDDELDDQISDVDEEEAGLVDALDVIDLTDTYFDENVSTE